MALRNGLKPLGERNRRRWLQKVEQRREKRTRAETETDAAATEKPVSVDDAIAKEPPVWKIRRYSLVALLFFAFCLCTCDRTSLVRTRLACTAQSLLELAAAPHIGMKYSTMCYPFERIFVHTSLCG